MTGSSTRLSWLETRRQYRRFLPYAHPDRGYFLLDAVSIVVAVVTNTIMIYLMGKPLSLIQHGQYDALVQVLEIFAGVLLVNQLSQFVGGWLTNRLVVSFIGRARNAVITKVLSLSFPLLGQFSRGDLLARFSNDVDRVSNILVYARLMLVSHILTLTLYVFMLFWINVQLALIALITLPLFILHQRFFSARKRRAAEAYLKSNGELVAFEEQSLANLRGISGNTAEEQVAARHGIVFNNAGHWLMREWDLNVGFGVSFTLLIYLVGLLVVVFGVQGIHKGEIPVGLLVSFLLYLGYLTVPVRGMSEIIFQFLGNVPAARRILAVMDASGVVSTNKDAPDLAVSKGEIIFEQVGFTYPDGKPVLASADVVINGGETIALVGPSGSGKSTFATLLLRFYDPQQGRILVDGQDLREINLNSLRHNMAVVWQAGFMVNDTIHANLLMANPEASEQQIIEACQASYAWEFIENLPKGLDTQLGAGGMELSGGQKQRLAIAQAFLRDTPILILDEASSALDSHSEQVIVQALDRLRRDRTTLMIAHRYSSVRSADRVIYFEGDGSLTMGLHQELFESHPDYRAAVEWQTGQPEKDLLL
jgi:ABC-type multidrug transport system fused ATPase/permease subunit